MKGIAFIGMMGTGKTVVGREVAERLGMNFGDVDDMIVARCGYPISVVFLQLGEKAFRDYEYATLSGIYWQDNFVISCGGGLALYERNMKLLEGYTIVRLTASADTIYDRTKDDFNRPLIKDNSPSTIARIMAERESSYAAVAHITVDTDGKTVSEVADEVIKRLCERGECD